MRSKSEQLTLEKHVQFEAGGDLFCRKSPKELDFPKEL
jgi:hypothetical protein